MLLALEFKALGVDHQAFHADALAVGGYKNHITICQLHHGNGALQQKVIQVECGLDMLTALDLHLQVATALRVYATGNVQVVQHAVHTGAVVQAGAVDIAAHKHTHGLGGGQRGVAAHVIAECLAHGGLHHGLQLVVAHAQHGHGAYMGQKDVAARVYGECLLKIERPPQADLNLVTNGDGVVWVELHGPRRAEGTGKELGTKYITGLVAQVVFRQQGAGGHGFAGRSGVSHCWVAQHGCSLGVCRGAWLLPAGRG